MRATDPTLDSAARRLLHWRRRLLVGTAAMLLVVGVLLAVVDPFTGNASGGGGVVDNGAPTGLATVMRRSLTSQTSVSGTLGYAGSWTVAVPAGTSATDLQQATQQETSARAAHAVARATASADEQTLAVARAALRSAQSNAGSTQTVSADQAAVTTAQQKVAVDQAQLAGARSMLVGARQALATAQSSAPPYGGSASFSMLPLAGDVILRGRPLYAINGTPTLLLYGTTPAWRSFAAGMSSGPDVAEVNANLRALGYGATAGRTFTSATEQAIRALQRAHGLGPTGRLPLGSVAFEPAAVRVTSVTPTVGQPAQPGPIMTLSSTRHEVSIPLEAAQQSQVKVGDRVLVTLPDNSTTPGVVSSVGTVATAPSSGQDNNAGNGTSGSSMPTVEVDVRLLHPAVTGTLDQAPVDVLITTASVRNALVVPVNALVALAGGGYAVEVVTANGTHELLPVTPGLFDDEAGRVQVTGGELAAGQRVVVPAST
jgi:peptidoglycan hydrolase-like protein with peptidoglycan-binding domain